MSTDEDTDGQDAEAENEALKGQVDAIAEALDIEVKPLESPEQFLARAKEIAQKAKEADEKRKTPEPDWEKHAGAAVGKAIAEYEKRRAEAENVDPPVDPKERKTSFAAPVLVPEDDEDSRDGFSKAGIIDALSLGTYLRPVAPETGAAYVNWRMGVPAGKDALTIGLQRLQDQIVIAGTILSHQSRRPYDEVVRESKLYSIFAQEAQRDEDLRKAMDTAESGAGSEWIPTDFSSQLHQRVMLQLRVAGLFPQFTMPQSPFTWPIEASRPTAYLYAESTANAATALTASDAGTGNITFTAMKIGARVLFSDELSEDSIIAVGPQVESDIAEAIAYGIENAVVNGDTAGTHFDTGDTVAATDVRRLWNGLRDAGILYAGSNTNANRQSLSTWSLNNLLNLIAKLGVRGGRPASDRVWITSVDGYVKMMQLSAVQTREVYGDKAIIYEGELGQIVGSPVVVTEHVSRALNATGIKDDCVTDNTLILHVYRPDFKLGNYSSRVESDRIVSTQQTQVVATQRKAFMPMAAAATNCLVSYGVDLAQI